MKRPLIVLSLLFLCLPAAAHAQTEVELFIGGYDPGAEALQVSFDNGLLFGARVGQSFLGFLGTEFSYTLARRLEEPALDFRENAHLLSGNFLVQLPLAGFVPFGTVGFGGIFGKTDTTFEIRRAFAWNAGGGLKLRNLVGPVGGRFDVRYYRIPDGIEFLPDLQRTDFDFVEVSGGLLLSF
jgi:hypothetical protein